MVRKHTNVFALAAVFLMVCALALPNQAREKVKNNFCGDALTEAQANPDECPDCPSHGFSAQDLLSVLGNAKVNGAENEKEISRLKKQAELYTPIYPDSIVFIRSLLQPPPSDKLSGGFKLPIDRPS